jgi:mono/diheme cytochrome c family protein
MRISIEAGPWRILASFLFVAGLAAPAGAWAEDPGDAASGRRLAQAWCANCHVFPGSTHATATGAPSFGAIAADPAVTASTLRGFLQTRHERMPDLHLSNHEADDLIAFVLSSRRR